MKRRRQRRESLEREGLRLDNKLKRARLCTVWFKLIAGGLGAALLLVSVVLLLARGDLDAAVHLARHLLVATTCVEFVVGVQLDMTKLPLKLVIDIEAIPPP
jgi:hypothetical protein